MPRWIERVLCLRGPRGAQAGGIVGLTPTSVTPHRVRLEFAVWIERMKTPKLQADAIRAIQAAMSEPVVRHFDIGADGSFTIDVALFQAAKEG